MTYQVIPIEPFGVRLEPSQKDLDLEYLDKKVLRGLFLQYHLIVLRGFKKVAGKVEISSFSEKLGPISIWPFGKVLELVQHHSPKDHIFDHSYVPLHWDGMYRPEIPEYQVFNCVRAPRPGHGGRTTFVNTMMALELADSVLLQNLEQISGRYRRKMEFYQSQIVSPLVMKHPHRDFKVIRYCEPHSDKNGNLINPAEMHFSGLPQEKLRDFHREFTHLLYSSSCSYSHDWQDGDVVIADNLSLLHGREAFVAHSPRHLQRVQVLSDPKVENLGLESYR